MLNAYNLMANRKQNSVERRRRSIQGNRRLRMESLEERWVLTGTPIVQIQLTTTDLAGNAITSVPAGSDFLVQATVQDLRPNGLDPFNNPLTRGVFSAYVDLSYAQSTTSLAANPLVYGSAYPNDHSGDTSVPGLIDEVGAFDGISPLGTAPILLFTTKFHADSPGSAAFNLDPADLLPAHQILVYGNDSVGESSLVPLDQINFVGATVTITGAVAPPLVKIQLTTTDLAGNAITSVPAGSDFLVQATVQDLRPNGLDPFNNPLARGVFSAYMDLTYNQSAISLAANPLVYGSAYPNSQSGNTSVPGLIDEVGAFDGVSPLGIAPTLLFTAQFHADATGSAAFNLDPADLLPQHQILVYGNDLVGESSLVPLDQVNFVGTTLTIGTGTAPVAVDDPTFSTSEDQLLNVPAPGVLGNDSDPNNDPISALLVTTTAHGSLTLNSDGSFAYQPFSGFAGIDSFTYRASDGSNESQVATATITVRSRKDVNNDGTIAPNDGAIVVNFINEFGGGPIGSPPPVINPDVSNDGFVSPLDFLMIVNYLNVQSQPLDGLAGGGANVGSPQMRVELTTTDTSGNPISSIAQGSDFLLLATVTDLRPASGGDPRGVFASYVDVAYDALKVGVGGPITHGSEYVYYASGAASTPGLLDEVGGFASLNPLGSDPQTLFSVPLHATAAGTVNFAALMPAIVPAHYSLVYGSNDAVAVEFLNASLTITPGANHAPAAVDDPGYSTIVNQPLSVPAPGVLGNDSDPDNDPISASIVTSTTHGSLTFNSNGSFDYQPFAGFVGIDSFTYQVTDGFDISQVATATITVGAVPPTVRIQLSTTDLAGNVITSVPAGTDFLVRATVQDLRPNGLDPFNQPLMRGVFSAYMDLTYNPSATSLAANPLVFDAAYPNSQSGDTSVPGLIDEVGAFDGFSATGTAPKLLFTAQFHADAAGSAAFNLDPADLLPQHQILVYGNDLVGESSLVPLDQVDFVGAALTITGTAAPPLVKIQLTTTDLAGNAIMTIPVGSEFLVQATVQDLRPNGLDPFNNPLVRGVFSAYMDLTYAQSMTSLAANPLVFGPAYPNDQSGNTSVPGLIDEVGAFDGVSSLGTAPKVLFTAKFHADAAGIAAFNLDPADLLPAHQILVYGNDTVGESSFVALDQVNFVGASINISAPADSDGVDPTTEDAGPNGGDGNGDGTPDSQQSNVTSLPNSANDHQYVTLESPSSTTLANVEAIANPSAGDAPQGVAFPIGFLAFVVDDVTAGDATTVTLYLPHDTAVDTYFKYGPTPDDSNPHWYEFLYNGTTGAEIIQPTGTDDPLKIILHFVDGQLGDDDLIANGEIHDPGSPGKHTNHVPVAHDDSYSIAEDATLTVAAPGVLANDTDIDGDILVATIIAGPAHGTLIFNSNGSFTYTPGLGSGATSDSFSYLVSDGHGGTATATVNLAISSYSGVSKTGGVLRIGGGAGSDVITVSGANIVVNGAQHSLAGVSEVRIWGRGGNDRIDLSGLAIKALVDGGEGDDALTGGSADDIIFGGAGDDTITGAAGNDFLIGGLGKDRIVGSAGNDILVSGAVDCVFNMADLRSISQAWSSTHSSSNAMIDDFIDEVLGDSTSDQLTGSAGADLFIINTGDTITDFKFGKPKDNKDGDVVIRDGVVVS